MGSTRTSITVLAGALIVASAGQALGASPARAVGCPVTTDRWQAVDLGVVGDARAINDQGQIAGWTRNAAGRSQAILWDDGDVIDLGTLGGPTSSASAIDEDGRVTGSSYTAGEKGHAFLWQNGIMEDLGNFHALTFPKDVSQGVVVGEFVGSRPDGTRRTQAFVVRNGVKTDLNVIAGSAASDINETGQIAGTHRRTDTVGLPANQQTQRAFLWENGTVTELGTLGGIWSETSGLNNLGQVVGQSALGADGVLQAGFVWSSGTGMRRIEDGGGLARPTAINDEGVIVGTHTCDAAGGTAYPAVWTDPAQAPVRLPDPPGGSANAATAVNAKGEIVGSAVYPGNQQRAVLWRPAGAGDGG
jgi:probable HAF family extracellular repeat protein